MKYLLILAGITLTVCCWGIYGPVLHKGQMGMQGSKLRPLICVGGAYVVIAIIVPVVILSTSGEQGSWSFSGTTWSMAAGTAGALGALGIIVALTSGGNPVYVMPIVFGGAPVVNVFLAMYWSKAWKEGVSPMFYAGLILVLVGAVTVLVFAPRKHPPKPHAAGQPAPIEKQSSPSAENST